MKEVSKLMGVRDSIRVVDATLRDGGLVNDFYFTDDFVKALYDANIKAGVDYMEVGYKASKEMFDVDKFGKWKFCDDDDVFEVLGDKNPALKLAVMTDVGRCDYKNDVHKCDESPFDLVRVATYIHQMPGAIDMIEDAKNKGYEVSCNIMAITTAQESDIKVALEMLGKSPVDVIYIVDSFGSFVPEQLARTADMYNEFAVKYGKKLGIHAHNNQQLAFANTIEAVGDGVDYLDATYNGMGRGAGNCPMENLLSFLKNPKYQYYNAIKFVENYMVPLKESGVKWGYDLQYMLTGVLNQHPRSAIAFTKDGRGDYCEFYKEIMGID
ncbi:aldolase catalytic domain-containing protein [Butyrivibrio proteoclasticus]|uniref:aldolase catalytic domain-containing protein n=1 Tax=Butyrivibrio proteoclasticus TaxID=43305 RepID=UPI00047DBDBE|nr:aldolase catalytic domain-containing protein [Butyrivibrio proteoclasticus]